MQEWDGISVVNKLDFSKAPIWVQIWGLPTNTKMIQMGVKLGWVGIWEVIDTRIFDMPDKTMIVKARIYLNTQSPICTGIYIGSKNNRITWIDFRYEKLPLFCFYYGIIGHGEDFCKRTISLIHDITKVNLLGSWIKATQLRRKHITLRKESSIVYQLINLIWACIAQFLNPWLSNWNLFP